VWEYATSNVMHAAVQQLTELASRVADAVTDGASGVGSVLSGALGGSESLLGSAAALAGDFVSLLLGFGFVL